MDPGISITSFYHFVPLPDLQASVRNLTAVGEELGLKGLVIVASEGVNGTVSGRASDIATFEARLSNGLGTRAPLFKRSTAKVHPFKKFQVKIRREIVTSWGGTVDDSGTHLPPEEWHRRLEEQDIQLIDIRNSYESQIGTFKNAIVPETKTFTELPAWLDESNLDVAKPTLIFCTGGVRCEKASLLFKQRGFRQVFQLEGGILNYLENHPDGHFRGKCFVFDSRVAVDATLQPTCRYALCEGCGNPVATAEGGRTCERCQAESSISPAQGARAEGQ